MDENWKISNDKFLDEFVRGREGIIYTLRDGKIVEEKRKPFSKEFIEDMTGIESRYFSPPDWPIHRINYESIIKALESGKTRKESIDGIINAGVTGAGNIMTFPAHSSIIQLHADLKDVRWTFDVATHQKSYETAADIAQALHGHQPGVYIGVFAKTKDDVLNPVFNTKLYGRVTGFEIYREGKAEKTIFSDEKTGLNNPEKTESERWEKDHYALGFIEEDYEILGYIIREELKAKNINPDEVKGLFVINQTQRDSPLVRTNAYEEMQLLGLSDLKYCFDVAAACASAQTAYGIGDGLVPKLPDGKKMIISVGESLEKITDMYYEEHMDMNNILFGTASAAFVLDRSYDKRGFVHFDGSSDPFDGRYMWIIKNENGYIRMAAGASVLTDAVKKVSRFIIDKVNLLGWNYDNNMEHHTHNANKRIFNGIGKRVGPAGISGEIIKNIHLIANASGASNAKMTADRFDIIQGKRVTGTAMGSGIATSFAAHQF
jgi:3-oxoacyl-[acyl-carrier-protein] synthase III